MSFDIREIIHSSISPTITLTQLDYVLIPVLKWTGRRNKLPQSFGLVKQNYDAPKIVLIGHATVGTDSTPRKCLLVINLIKKEIEKLKILSFIDAR